MRKKSGTKWMMISALGAITELDHQSAVELLVRAVNQDKEFGRVIDDVAIRMSIDKLNRLLDERQMVPTAQGRKERTKPYCKECEKEKVAEEGMICSKCEFAREQ